MKYFNFIFNKKNFKLFIYLIFLMKNRIKKSRIINKMQNSE